ncbi:glutaredoxin 2 isoform X4 [Dendrobates tinctorius]|uniref:glutaredoxin 2 isoform X4 n=1 Tax=Dendrobates tinctorius TaxID=92724 RepID=UPI003CCA194B
MECGSSLSGRIQSGCSVVKSWRGDAMKLCSLPLRKGACDLLSKRFTASLVYRMGNLLSNSADLPNSQALKLVEETISENCVVIYSKTTCPYCTMAKDAFNSINVNFKSIELDEVDNGRQLQEALHHMTGVRSVPRVFVNGACIGGGTETRRLNQEGKLIDLVQQCNRTTKGT